MHQPVTMLLELETAGVAILTFVSLRERAWILCYASHGEGETDLAIGYCEIQSSLSKTVKFQSFELQKGQFGGWLVTCVENWLVNWQSQSPAQLRGPCAPRGFQARTDWSLHEPASYFATGWTVQSIYPYQNFPAEKQYFSRVCKTHWFAPPIRQYSNQSDLLDVPMLGTFLSY